MKSQSKAELLGIVKGDLIVATSATVGDQMWMHETAESVHSALSTRFVLSPTVQMRLERPLSSISSKIRAVLAVPMFTTVRLKPPIGLHVRSGDNGLGVFVDNLRPDFAAAKSQQIAIGDEIVAMSASWGDKLWDVKAVESFIVGMKMRIDKRLTLKFKRMIPVDVFIAQAFAPKKESKPKPVIESKEIGPPLYDRIIKVSSRKEFVDMWNEISAKTLLVTSIDISPNPRNSLDVRGVNVLMSTALKMGCPEIAAEIFEKAFGYKRATTSLSSTTASEVLRVIDVGDEDGNKASSRDSSYEGRSPVARNTAYSATFDFAATNQLYLQPNNYVISNAIKAYGRAEKHYPSFISSNIVQWAENEHGVKPDIFVMTALLYTFAKTRRVKEAEDLFWKEIPRRGLTYTHATTNSLMYMYAKANRPDDALRVYELIKASNVELTVVTYGILVKALMRSGKKKLQETVFEIVKSLPQLGINPTIEIYHQIMEYYSKIHDHMSMKRVLTLMKEIKPRVKLDALAYTYVINCYAGAKLPKLALGAFKLMRRKGIPSDEYTYMGVLQSLANMRDGVAAVQVLSEMLTTGINVDINHYAMTMFACLLACQFNLAESLVLLYLKHSREPLDTVLCNLWLRALLAQNKWDGASALLSKMKNGELASVDLVTYRYLVQYQIMTDRWADASLTVGSMLQLYSAELSRVNHDGAMADGFKGISFAFGSYSSEVNKYVYEDNRYNRQNQIINSIKGDAGRLPSSSSRQAQPTEEIDDSLTTEGEDEEFSDLQQKIRNGRDDDDEEFTDDRSFDFSPRRKVPKIIPQPFTNKADMAAEVKAIAKVVPTTDGAAPPTPSTVLSQPSIVTMAMAMRKPTPQALQFVMEVFEMIAQFDNILVPVWKLHMCVA